MEAPLYVLRHGQTEWNVERRLQGQRNSDLTSLGRQQATDMGRALAAVLPRDRRAVRFLRSPLGRTRETSLLIGCELRIDPAAWQDDPRLAEHGSGAWEGLTWSEIEHDRPGTYAAWKRDPERHGPPGGESHHALERRTASILAEIASSRTCTVVVGHGVSGAVLRGLAQGLCASEALALDKPQTAFFRLQAGSEERIEAM